MENHRTAKLWLQYMEMIGILRMFTYKLSKQCYHILQQPAITCMRNQHTCICRRCSSYRKPILTFIPVSSTVSVSSGGVNAIGAGLSTDLSIEQVLMRSIKTNGGLNERSWADGDPTCHMAAFHAILCRCQSGNE